MPKRKAATENNAEKSTSGDSSAKKAKAEAKQSGSGRGRGRPPLSAEEKQKRAAMKEANKSNRGRGRPKGSKPWLSFSPWVRKPLPYTKSPPLDLKSSPSNTAMCQEKKSAFDVWNSIYDSDSDCSDVQNENPSTPLDEDNFDDPKSPASNNDSPKELPVSNQGISFKSSHVMLANISEPLTKDPTETNGKAANISEPLTKDPTETNGKADENSCCPSPSSPCMKMSSSSTSQEESEVLKLQKEKLTIEIQVLHLKKRKLILQLEQMAHSSAPYHS